MSQGIKESKELLQSVIDAIDVIEKVMEDGKLTAIDFRYAPQFVAAIKPGLDGISKVQIEAADYDLDELKELSALGVELALKLISKLS